MAFGGLFGSLQEHDPAGVPLGRGFETAPLRAGAFDQEGRRQIKFGGTPGFVKPGGIGGHHPTGTGAAARLVRTRILSRRIGPAGLREAG